MTKKKKIEHQELVNLARMSRIAMSDEQLRQLLPQIESVLEYASCLAQVGQEHTPGLMPKNSNVFRPDKAESTDSKPLLAQGPDVQEDYFVVPTIVKKD